MSQLLLNCISMTIFECMQIRRWSCSRIFLWPRLNIWYGALYELLLSRGGYRYHQDACLIFFHSSSSMLLLKCRVFVTRAVKWDRSNGLSHTSFFYVMKNEEIKKGRMRKNILEFSQFTLAAGNCRTGHGPHFWSQR